MKRRKEPDWKAALRTEVERTSTRRAARRLRCSATRINQVLNGKYPHRTKSIESAVRNQLMARPVRPLQFRQIDPDLHRQVRDCVRRWGTGICSVWWPSNPDELLAHVMSRSKVDATPFVELVRKLGLPGFTMTLAEDHVRVFGGKPTNKGK